MKNTKKSIEEKLNRFISNQPSKWIEEATWREQNADWLDRSFLIALKVLRTLRKNNLSQVWLADELKVSPQHISKIIKGSENLTLETISKLEKALGIRLLEVPGFYGNIVHAAEQCLSCKKYEKPLNQPSAKMDVVPVQEVAQEYKESQEYNTAA